MNKNEYHHQYYLKHREEILARVRTWREDNPGKVSAYAMKHNKKTYVYFCKQDEYEQIENYELAKADNFKGWDCHHRLELHPDGSLRFTKDSLKKLCLYVNRPASELIFLTHSEHARLHSISKKEYNE